MANYFTFPYPSKCGTSNFSQSEFCLPQGQYCDVPGNDIINDDLPWNLQLCQSDVPYCIPIRPGDKLSIQTQFAGNPDNPDPFDGISVGIYSPSGQLIDGSNAYISDACAGKSESSVYQTYQFDVDYLKQLGDTFRIGFSVDGKLTSTETYCFDDGCQSRSVLLEGKFEGVDCYGNDYRNSDCQYSNSIRVYGTVVDRGGGIEKTYFGRKSRKTEVFVNYELVLTKPVPPRIKDRILKQILAGSEVLIDGQSVRVDNFQIQNMTRVGNMFRFSIPFSTTCKTGSLLC